MHTLRIVPLLLFLVSVLPASAQRFTNDKILRLEPHPSDDNKFIAKFFDKQTLKIVEHWEMKSLVSDITSENFNDLKKQRYIFAHGTCYTFYPKVKVKTETTYENGVIVGEQKGYFENRQLKYTANRNPPRRGKSVYYYKNGNIRKIEEYAGGWLQGEVIQYYKDGKKQSIANFEKSKLHGKYQSFHTNGQIKRKAKYKMGKEETSKCSDKNGNTVPCLPFLSEPEYPGSFDALKAELEKIDLSFNKANTDTAIFRIILEIDTLGNAQLARYHFEHADSLQIMLKEWTKSLSTFSPSLIDGFRQTCKLNIALTISSDKFIWLGEPSKFYTLFDLSSIEKKPTLFWEFPYPTNDHVYFIVDEMPKFPGGENSLRNYISDHIQFPREAKEKKIYGKVYVTFIVEKDGSVSNAAIAQGVHPLLNGEALRVISKLPNFKPGTSKGRPVRVSYTVPINFSPSRKTSLGSSIQRVPTPLY